MKLGNRNEIIVLLFNYMVESQAGGQGGGVNKIFKKMAPLTIFCVPQALTTTPDIAS